MILLTVAWIYLSIQSPFLIFCFYGVIRRFSWIAAPEVVVPAFIMVCSAFFLFFDQVVPSAGNFSHFAFAGVFLIVGYSALLWFRYDRVDALVLSALTMIAIDELWQTPFNVLNWTHSLYWFETGFTTAGWEFMAIPFIAYFISKSGRRISLTWAPKIALLTALILTVFETWRYYSVGYPGDSVPTLTVYNGIEPYYLIAFWFLFFIAVFSASKSRPASLLARGTGSAASSGSLAPAVRDS